MKLKFRECIKKDNALFTLGSKRCLIDLALEIATLRKVLKPHVEFVSDNQKNIKDQLTKERKFKKDEDFEKLSLEDQENWNDLVVRLDTEIQDILNKEIDIPELDNLSLNLELIKKSEEKYNKKEWGDLAFYIDGNIFTDLKEFIK